MQHFELVFKNSFQEVRRISQSTMYLQILQAQNLFFQIALISPTELINNPSLMFKHKGGNWSNMKLLRSGRNLIDVDLREENVRMASAHRLINGSNCTAWRTPGGCEVEHNLWGGILLNIFERLKAPELDKVRLESKTSRSLGGMKTSKRSQRRAESFQHIYYLWENFR